MQKFTQPIPLSLYIHLPWCVKKCPYCDFNSHQAPDSLPEALYVNALIKDLEEHLPSIWGRRIQSIFFGGGTPSLFSERAVASILEAVHTRLNFGADTEITLEANPGTIDESRFRGYRLAGVNRLSIGLQSLQDDKLKALGRIHDRSHALRAIDIAQQVGFDNFNLDLMHGLPNQSVTDAMQDLNDALAYAPNHLSWYQLTIEPNTLFHHQPPNLPNEDILADIQDSGKALLESKGMPQYEVSAYSKLTKECLHNINYWEYGDYLGIGAGAHSKITDIENAVIRRHWQVKNPRDYLDPQKAFIAETKIIPENEVIFEFMLNALRLTQGVPLNYFFEKTGIELSTIKPILSAAEQKKLIITSDTTLCATELGHQFLNDLVAMFLIK
jgi:putative oxygen-independent coproporphyrinogen III oxidase